MAVSPLPPAVLLNSLGAFLGSAMSAPQHGVSPSVAPLQCQRCDLRDPHIHLDQKSGPGGPEAEEEEEEIARDCFVGQCWVGGALFGAAAGPLRCS